jgi:hypothetical protein
MKMVYGKTETMFYLETQSDKEFSLQNKLTPSELDSKIKNWKQILLTVKKQKVKTSFR